MVGTHAPCTRQAAAAAAASHPTLQRRALMHTLAPPGRRLNAGQEAPDTRSARLPPPGPNATAAATAAALATALHRPKPFPVSVARPASPGRPPGSLEQRFALAAAPGVGPVPVTGVTSRHPVDRLEGGPGGGRAVQVHVRARTAAKPSQHHPER